MSKVTETVRALAEPVAKENGCIVWDVEYVKEAGSWYLRLYIDKLEGGVSINDCENVSRALDPILDEHDPIPDAYIFEVSSAGAERTLKRASDFERFIGSRCEVKLYKAIDGRKEYVGELKGYNNGDVTISVADTEYTFESSQIANVHLVIS